MCNCRNNTASRFGRGATDNGCGCGNDSCGTNNLGCGGVGSNCDSSCNRGCNLFGCAANGITNTIFRIVNGVDRILCNGNCAGR